MGTLYPKTCTRMESTFCICRCSNKYYPNLSFIKLCLILGFTCKQHALGQWYIVDKQLIQFHVPTKPYVVFSHGRRQLLVTVCGYIFLVACPASWSKESQEGQNYQITLYMISCSTSEESPYVICEQQRPICEVWYLHSVFVKILYRVAWFCAQLRSLLRAFFRRI